MKVPKKIKAMPWPEPVRAGMQTFRVTLDWPVVDGTRLMVVTVNPNRAQHSVAKPFRMICNKKAMAVTTITPDGKHRRQSFQEAAARAGVPSVKWSYPEIDPEDEKKLATFIGAKKETTNHYMAELDAWTMAAVKAETKLERDARGEIRDEDVDLCPEELPEGLVEYIQNTVLPDDNVLLYKKGNVRGTCYLCRQKVRAIQGQRFRQHEMTTCPNCHRKVHSILETSGAFLADYVQNIATIQTGTDGKTVFVREWHLCRDYTAAWDDIPAHLVEVARYAARGTKAAKWQKEAKENWYMNCTRYDLPCWQRVKNVTEVYDGSYYFYLPPTCQEGLKGTSLEYIDLQGYIDAHPSKYTAKNPIRFILDWARYPAVEKLWKAGYTTAVMQKVNGVDKKNAHAVRWSRESIKDAIRFPARHLKRMAPARWTMDELGKMARIWGMVEEGLANETDVSDLLAAPDDFEKVATAFAHATVHKVLRYVDKIQAAEDERVGAIAAEAKKKGRHYSTFRENMIRTYRDYLQDCEQLHLNLDDRAVLFPANLKHAHARTTAEIKYQATKENEAAFQKQVAKLARLAWERGGLLIRPAASQKELIEEGAALHHCVGGYAERMAQGETAIFFIRRASDPDRPFYTLELAGGRVIQCRTDHNATYTQDPELNQFVDTWMAEVVQKPKKKDKAVTAA